MKILLVIVVLCSIQIVTSTFCYWNTGCPYKYFSDKTAYNAVRGDIRDSLVKLTGCEPVSIWGFLRHGQTYPGLKYDTFGQHMKAAVGFKNYILDSYERGNCSLCAQDVENLGNWQVNNELFRDTTQLTKEGYQESEGVGRRLKQAFPKLLAKLDKNDYQIRPAVGAWNADSAKAFADGVYDRQLTVQAARTDLDILSPFTTCKKYNDLKEDPKTFAESEKYMRSSDYLASKDRIQRRLGIDYLLTDTNITALWDLCRYTSSGLTGRLSPWCALFTTEDLKVLEYIADLKHYYGSGYGTPLSELFGQITLSDLLRNFLEVKSGKGKKITTYISRGIMMDMVYTALKLCKDSIPLTGSKRKHDRQWRTSKIAAHSSNLIVVLNKCNKGTTSDYNVVFYLNEEPLQSICKEGVCTWREFEDKLSPFLNTNTVDFCG